MSADGDTVRDRSWENNVDRPVGVCSVCRLLLVIDVRSGTLIEHPSIYAYTGKSVALCRGSHSRPL